MRFLGFTFLIVAIVTLISPCAPAQSGSSIETTFGKRDDIITFRLRIPRRDLGDVDPASVFFRPTDRKTFSLTHTLETKHAASGETPDPATGIITAPQAARDTDIPVLPAESIPADALPPPRLPRENDEETRRRALTRLYKEGKLTERDRRIVANLLSEVAMQELTRRDAQAESDLNEAFSAQRSERDRLRFETYAAAAAVHYVTNQRDDLTTLLTDMHLPQSLRVAAERLIKRKEAALGPLAERLKTLEKKLQDAPDAPPPEPLAAEAVPQPTVQEIPPEKKPDEESKVQPEPEIEYVDVYGRLRDASATGVALYSYNRVTGAIQRVKEFRITPPAVIAPNEEFVRAWAQNWTRQIAYQTYTESDNGFSLYESAYITKKLGLPSLYLGDSFIDRNGRRRNPPDLYSVMTGATAIRESLQTDVELNTDEVNNTKLTPISALNGPNIKSHPFAEMLKGRQSITGDMERLIPHDQYFFHFSSTFDLNRLAELMEQWGENLLHTLDAQSRDRRIKERISEQLALSRERLERLMQSHILRIDIDDVGITGGDPYFTDGNDVTVIFKVRSGAFRSEASTQREAFKKRFPAAVASNESHRGIAIDLLVTPNREVSSYLANIDEYWIISNSPVAIRRVIDTAKGERRNLRDANEYRYMRSVFPANRDAENAFLYLSDAFIRRVVGPEQKIARQRQLQAVKYLTHVQNAVLLRTVEHGETPGLAFETLVTEGRVESPVTGCVQCGVISLVGDGTAKSSVFGTLNRLTPLVEIPITEVNANEAKGYQGFVENYNQYWSRYFDPVGIQFRLSLNKKIEIETCILPLIENSIYNNLRDVIGGEPTPMDAGLSPQTVGSLGFAFKKDSAFYKSLTADLRARSEKRGVGDDSTLLKLLDLSEGTLIVNLQDASPQLGVSARELSKLALGSGRLGGFETFIGLALTVLTMPTYVTLDVKNPKLAQTLIDQLIRENQLQSALFFGFSADDITDAYFLEPHRGVPIGVQTFSALGVTLRLYAAVVENKIVIATQREVLADVINARLDGTARQTESLPSNALFNFRPEAFQKLKPSVSATWQERMRQASFSNFGALRVLYEDLGVDAKDIDAASLRWFGYTPICPSGGGYSYDAATGEIRSNVYGERFAPRQSVQLDTSRGFPRFIESLRNVMVRFQFTPEGVRTRLTIERRATQ